MKTDNKELREQPLLRKDAGEKNRELRELEANIAKVKADINSDKGWWQPHGSFEAYWAKHDYSRIEKALAQARAEGREEAVRNMNTSSDWGKNMVTYDELKAENKRLCDNIDIGCMPKNQYLELKAELAESKRSSAELKTENEKLKKAKIPNIEICESNKVYDNELAKLRKSRDKLADSLFLERKRWRKERENWDKARQGYVSLIQERGERLAFRQRQVEWLAKEANRWRNIALDDSWLDSDERMKKRITYKHFLKASEDAVSSQGLCDKRKEVVRSESNISTD